jgi:hypothetical protein
MHHNPTHWGQTQSSKEKNDSYVQICSYVCIIVVELLWNSQLLEYVEVTK